MSSDALRRRFTVIILASAAVALPAGVLRGLCAGRSCQQVGRVADEVPFCSLPPQLRHDIEGGFYERRSPELVVVSGSTLITGTTLGEAGTARALWTSTALPSAGRVPVVFAGSGIPRGQAISPDPQLRDVAPTLAAAVGLRRPHPRVRSGVAIEGMRAAPKPRLVLEVVWKGIGSTDLERQPDAWRTLRRLMAEGMGTLDGRVGAVPLDPAAAATTIGTGGLPSEHGIISGVFRNEVFYRAPAGKLLRAWGPGPTGSAITAIGDDLELGTGEEAAIGLVGTDVSDRGLIGGRWQPNHDEDIVVLRHGASATSLARTAVGILRRGGFGLDETPDFLAVAVGGPVEQLDRLLARLVTAAREVAGRQLTIAVTATGSTSIPAGAEVIHATELVSRIERALPGAERVIEAASPAGLFLDDETLRSGEISEADVLRAVLGLRDPTGDHLVDDAFSGIAITLGRYC